LREQRRQINQIAGALPSMEVFLALDKLEGGNVQLAGG